MRLPETLQDFVHGAPGRSPRSVHPVRVVPTGFLTVIAIGTVLLALPAATASGRGAPLLTALFTAVSATCVTGLVTVDTGTYWSAFGQVVILAMISPDPQHTTTDARSTTSESVRGVTASPMAVRRTPTATP